MELETGAWAGGWPAVVRDVLRDEPAICASAFRLLALACGLSFPLCVLSAWAGEEALRGLGTGLLRRCPSCCGGGAVLPLATLCLAAAAVVVPGRGGEGCATQPIGCPMSSHLGAAPCLQNTAYDRAYAKDPVPGPGSYENESDRYGLGSTCVLQGPKSDNSFRDFSSSFGTSQRSSIVRGGPIDAREVFSVAPAEYHISTQFDDLLARSSFAASSRRIGASNKGLHSHYTTNRWMKDTRKSFGSSSQRLPRIPGVETLGGTSSLAQTLTSGGAPVSGTAPGVKHVMYMRERQKVVPNARPRHMH